MANRDPRTLFLAGLGVPVVGVGLVMTLAGSWAGLWALTVGAILLAGAGLRHEKVYRKYARDHPAGRDLPKGVRDGYADWGDEGTGPSNKFVGEDADPFRS